MYCNYECWTVEYLRPGTEGTKVQCFARWAKDDKQQKINVTNKIWVTRKLSEIQTEEYQKFRTDFDYNAIPITAQMQVIVSFSNLEVTEPSVAESHNAAHS